MRVRAGVAGAVTAVALTATALAQDPARPVGSFGGGSVLAPPKDPLGAGSAVVGMRAAADGRLQIEATVRGRCGGGTFPARTTVADDGSFLTMGTSRRRPEPGVRLKTTYEIGGTLTAAGVRDGRAKTTSEIRVSGEKTARCRSGTVAFQVRRPTTGLGAPGAAPRARYYGITSETRNRTRRGIVMRVSSDGRSLTRALYAVTLTCGKLKLPDVVDTPRRSLRIDADGRVKDRVLSTSHDATTVTSADERFSGKLGSTGASGTLSITERTRSRVTGRLVETCRTGSIRWTAVP